MPSKRRARRPIKIEEYVHRGGVAKLIQQVGCEPTITDNKIAR